jgi:hypothetical protein
LTEIDEVGGKVLESRNSMPGRAEVLKHPYSDCVALCRDSGAEVRRVFLPSRSHNECEMSLEQSAEKQEERGSKRT